MVCGCNRRFLQGLVFRVWVQDRCIPDIFFFWVGFIRRLVRINLCCSIEALKHESPLRAPPPLQVLNTDCLKSVPLRGLDCLCV